MKPISRRPAAMADMRRQVAYRREAAGEASALSLVDEMAECLQSISQAPAMGAHRIGQLLGVPGVQWRRVGKTKLWFWYVEELTYIDVLRLVSTDQLPRLAMLPADLR
jgi:plasmid stabilization system protein ParE